VLEYYNKSLLITNASPEFESEKEIIIPYGTDLTDYNKFTFFQSIIDNVIMGNPYGNLYDKITDGQKYPVTIKTIIGDTIYPRTTNTIITLYYSSYMDTLQAHTDLLEYYTDNTGTAYPAITISIAKTSPSSSELILTIMYTNSTGYNQYKATKDTPKVVIDLTGDLAIVRPGEEIASFKFKKSDTPWITADVYYQNCIDILGNVFISYSYKD
jgi:hypothetical protein